MQPSFDYPLRRFLSILSGAIVIATLFVIVKGFFFHQALSLSWVLKFVVAGVVIATVIFEYKRMQRAEQEAALPSPDSHEAEPSQ